MMWSRRARGLAKSAPAGLALALAAGIARADDNDLMLGAINDYCANPKANIGETVKLVLRSPHQARDFGTLRKPVYVRDIYLAKLGATLSLKAASATAPVRECQFVGYSDDMAGLAPRLLKSFDLPEPTIREVDSTRVTQRKAEGSRRTTVELEYGLQDNQKSGAFNLMIKR